MRAGARRVHVARRRVLLLLRARALQCVMAPLGTGSGSLEQAAAADAPTSADELACLVVGASLAPASADEPRRYADVERCLSV